jgi:oligoribonuclease (3'-5' exoribonuclease)
MRRAKYSAIFDDYHPDEPIMVSEMRVIDDVAHYRIRDVEGTVEYMARAIAEIAEHLSITLKNPVSHLIYEDKDDEMH